jgi:succinoglycan biosynthesis transport protein ExoP
MTFTQFASILQARWRSVLSVLLAVVAIVVGISLFLTEKYTATASVLVDIKSPDPIASGSIQGIPVSSFMATQIDVINSERVALRAMKSLKLDEREDLKEQWLEATEGKGNYEAWLAAVLQRRLEVKPSRESNVITVNYESPDPEFAASMANAFMKAYVDTTLDLKVEPARQYNAFFDERSLQLRANLEKAQTRLSAYQQDKGIIATDERLDIENARLTELSSQLVALQSVAAESAGRQGQASANADRMQEVMNNPLIASLSAEVARQEARLNELNERLGDRHPQVLELRANLSQMRTKLATETRRVGGSLSVDNSVNETRLVQLRALLEEQRKRVLQLKGQRDEASVMLRDVENAQRAYDAVLERVNQTNMESQNTQTNVTMLKQATTPAFPSSPRVLLNTVVAVFLGLLLGVGLALLREFTDRRMRSEEDIVEVLHQPVLAVLPGARLLGNDRSRLRLTKSRVVRSLPKPSF